MAKKGTSPGEISLTTSEVAGLVLPISSVLCSCSSLLEEYSAASYVTVMKTITGGRLMKNTKYLSLTISIMLVLASVSAAQQNVQQLSQG